MLVDMKKRMVPGNTYRLKMYFFGKVWWTRPMKCNSCTEHSPYRVSYFMSYREGKDSYGMYYWQRSSTLRGEISCIIDFECSEISSDTKSNSSF